MSGLVPLPGGGSNALLSGLVQRGDCEKVESHVGLRVSALLAWLIGRLRLAAQPLGQPVAQTRRIGVRSIRKRGILPLKVKPLTALRA